MITPDADDPILTLARTVASSIGTICHDAGMTLPTLETAIKVGYAIEGEVLHALRQVQQAQQERDARFVANYPEQGYGLARDIADALRRYQRPAPKEQP